MRNVGLSLLFTVVGAYFAAQFFPLSIVAVATTMLVTHELGHWWSALARGGEPDPPVVIPFGLFSVGFTRIRKLPELSARTKRYIIASGPIAGVIGGISLVPFAVLQPQIVLYTLLMLIILEVYGGIFGLDGKRWRKERVHHGAT